MTLVVILNVLFSALVVVGIVGHLGLAILRDRELHDGRHTVSRQEPRIASAMRRAASAVTSSI